MSALQRYVVLDFLSADVIVRVHVFLCQCTQRAMWQYDFVREPLPLMSAHQWRGAVMWTTALQAHLCNFVGGFSVKHGYVFRFNDA